MFLKFEGLVFLGLYDLGNDGIQGIVRVVPVAYAAADAGVRDAGYFVCTG